MLCGWVHVFVGAPTPVRGREIDAKGNWARVPGRYHVRYTFTLSYPSNLPISTTSHLRLRSTQVLHVSLTHWSCITNWEIPHLQTLTP